MGAPFYWRRRRRLSSVKTRNAILWALRDGVPTSPIDLSAEMGMRHSWVCRALDDMAIRGLVEVGEWRYRRTDREAASV